MKIFEEVVTVKLRGSFTRPLRSSTLSSCTDIHPCIYLSLSRLCDALYPLLSVLGL